MFPAQRTALSAVVERYQEMPCGEVMKRERMAEAGLLARRENGFTEGWVHCLWEQYGTIKRH